jgi:hypothetical protein
MSVAARVTGGLAILLAGCAGETGVAPSGGQLMEDRARCLPFVQAHSETTPALAEAACLIPRGYRAPLPLAQGTAPIGSLYATGRGDEATMVKDFEACNVEAFKTPMPEIRDEKTSGIFSNVMAGLFPRGIFVKAMTPDEWLMKSFAACLTRRGYTVSGVTIGR